jgi:hypothetical protein
LSIDTTAWKRIGQSPNAEFFEIEPRVLAVLPHEGGIDDENSARTSIRIQQDYIREHGQPAAVVVFTDAVAEQTSGARSVYRALPEKSTHACFALVSASTFGRAVASIFIGISRPSVPTRLFGTLDEALVWAREVVGQA